MKDRNLQKSSGKTVGRPRKLAPKYDPNSTSFDFQSDDMERDLKEKLAKLGREENRLRTDPDLDSVSYRIVMSILAKRGGNTIRKQAMYLLRSVLLEKMPNVDAKQITDEMVRQDGRLPALERWLRDPTASSYLKAISPRVFRKRIRKKKYLIPFAGKD